MRREATLSAMDVCHLLVYTPMRWRPAASIDSTTTGYSYSTPVPRLAVSPMILCATQWWNPSRILRIPPVTTHLLLPYKSNACATTLYIAPQARTVATVISSTLANILHHL